jgi:hypothetical protein
MTHEQSAPSIPFAAVAVAGPTFNPAADCAQAYTVGTFKPEKLFTLIGRTNYIREQTGQTPLFTTNNPTEAFTLFWESAQTALANRKPAKDTTGADIVTNRLLLHLAGFTSSDIGRQETPPKPHKVISQSLTRVIQAIATPPNGTAVKSPASTRTKRAALVSVSFEAIKDTPRPLSVAFRDGAPCTTVPNPDIFFSDDETEKSRAVTICTECPVRIACLSYAIEHTAATEGIIGGLNKTQRQKLTTMLKTYRKEQASLSAKPTAEAAAS